MPEDERPLPTRYVEPEPARKKPLPLVRPRGAGGSGPRVRSRGTTLLLPGRDRGALFVFEWATVVVIIAIVLTITIPAYRRSTSAARAAACATNLMRLGQMAAMYVQDHDGVYPPLPRAATLEEATAPRVAPELAWTVRFKPYREPKEKQDPFTCPAADAPTYAYNAALGATVFPNYDPKSPPAAEADVVRPTETFLFWDTANLGTANALAGYRFFYGAKQNGKYRRGDFVLASAVISEGWIYPRHNDASNVVYCDGHVRRVAAANTAEASPGDPFDPRHPDAKRPEGTSASPGASPSPSPSASASPE